MVLHLVFISPLVNPSVIYSRSFYSTTLTVLFFITTHLGEQLMRRRCCMRVLLSRPRSAFTLPSMVRTLPTVWLWTEAGALEKWLRLKMVSSLSNSVARCPRKPSNCGGTGRVRGMIRRGEGGCGEREVERIKRIKSLRERKAV